MPFNNEIQWKSSGTIAPSSFVTIDPAFDEQVKQSVVGDSPCGVMWEAQKGTPGLPGSDTTVAAQSGDYGFRVVGQGNDCLLQLGGTVSPGNSIKPDGNGFGISGAVNDNCGAVALQAGTNGVKIRVQVWKHKG